MMGGVEEENWDGEEKQKVASTAQVIYSPKNPRPGTAHQCAAITLYPETPSITQPSIQNTAKYSVQSLSKSRPRLYSLPNRMTSSIKEHSLIESSRTFYSEYSICFSNE